MSNPFHKSNFLRSIILPFSLAGALTQAQPLRAQQSNQPIQMTTSWDKPPPGNQVYSRSPIYQVLVSTHSSEVVQFRSLGDFMSFPETILDWRSNYLPPSPGAPWIDYSGRNNHGLQPNPDKVPTIAADGSLQFDGIDDTIQTDRNRPLVGRDDPFTLIMVMKPSLTDPTPKGSFNVIAQMGENTDSNNRPKIGMFQMRDMMNTEYTYSNGSANGSTVTATTGPRILDTNRYNIVIVTAEAGPQGRVSNYINGQLVYGPATGNTSRVNIAGDPSFKLGGDKPNDGSPGGHETRHFKGNIKQVVLIRQLLTAAEVQVANAHLSNRNGVGYERLLREMIPSNSNASAAERQACEAKGPERCVVLTETENQEVCTDKGENPDTRFCLRIIIPGEFVSSLQSPLELNAYVRLRLKEPVETLGGATEISSYRFGPLIP